MDSLRGNVLVEVTQSLEEAIMEQPTAEKCVPRKVISHAEWKEYTNIPLPIPQILQKYTHIFSS